MAPSRRILAEVAGEGADRAWRGDAGRGAGEDAAMCRDQILRTAAPAGLMLRQHGRRCRTSLPPGAARNALDCAPELEAKERGLRLWQLAGATRRRPRG